MSLFKGKDAAEVVKPKDIIKQSGINPEDLGLDDKDNSDDALEDLIKVWIEQVESHIYVRLDYEIKKDDKGYEAIKGILTGNVMNMVTFALQQRRSRIIQLGDYAVDIIDASEVTKNLDKQLKPFQKAGEKLRMSVFLSSKDYEDDDES